MVSLRLMELDGHPKECVVGSLWLRMQSLTLLLEASLIPWNMILDLENDELNDSSL